MKSCLPLLCLLLSFTCSDPYEGRIIQVIDGDTFVFQTGEGSLKVRLQGIDAPEMSQDYGEESKAYLETFMRKEAGLRQTGVDQYGRTLGVLIVNGKNVNLEMVRTGYAWQYDEYSEDLNLARAEAQARRDKLGLWAGPAPEAPWEYRERKRKGGR